MLNIETLFIATLTAQTILTVMTALVFYGRFRDGLRSWVIAGTLEVLGWVLFTQVSDDPDSFIGIVAVFALSLCLGFMRAGLKQFFGNSISHYQIWMPSLACGVLKAIQICLEAPHVTVVLINLVLTGQVVWCITALTKVHHESTERSSYLLLMGLIFLCCSFFSRVVLALLLPDSMPNFRAETPLNMMAFWLTFASAIVINVSFLTMHQDRAWYRNLKLAMSDALTGLLNRRALFDAASRAIGAARRLESGLVVMLIDIDYFKRINDELGHPVGDMALRKFAEVLQAHARQSDWVARYGGEEFCVLMPNSHVEDAQQLAHRLRNVLLAEPLQPYGLTLRFSAGICAWSPDDATLDKAIAKADAAMYRAKQGGRDRVEVEQR
jgi:diguanylate cyclase (GGDEF)-like protein